MVYENLQDLLELTPPKDVLFITGDRDAKGGSQEIVGVTVKFCLGVQNEAGQRLIELCQENEKLTPFLFVPVISSFFKAQFTVASSKYTLLTCMDNYSL